MKSIILDAGPLITSCKFAVDGVLVIDFILSNYQVIIAEAVRDEVVIAGSRFRDAREAGKRIFNNKIQVLESPVVFDILELLNPYQLGIGEQESILLLNHSLLSEASLIVDDHLAHLVSIRLGYKTLFLLDLIVQMANDGILTSEMAIKITEAVQSRYPQAFVEHTLLLLERLK